MDRAALERIPREEWERIAMDLAAYAAANVRRLRWRTGNRKDLAQGQTAEDIPQKAVELVLLGKRDWDPRKNPDLLQYLRDVVDSLVNNLVMSDDNRLMGRLPQTDDGVDAEEMLKRAQPWDEHAEHLPRPPANAEELAIAVEEEERIAGEVFAAADENPELQRVVEAIMDGHGKPAEIAAATGFEVKRVYQLLRTLKRHVASRADAKARA